MNIKKIAVILVALVAGGAAFYLTLTGQETAEPAPAPAIQATREKTLGVLVAATDIYRGDRLTPDSFEWREWPEKVVSQSADFITSEDEGALERLEGAVAKTSMIQGEPVLETKVVQTGSRGLMAAIMNPGMRAVALRVTAETAAGGFILPGDRVDVVYTRDGNRNNERGVVSTLFEDVRVLAVNEIFSENPDTPVIEGVNVTLELLPIEAEQFIGARSEGDLSLILRSIHEQAGEGRTAPAPQVQDNTEQPAPVVRSQTKRVRVIRVGRS